MENRERKMMNNGRKSVQTGDVPHFFSRNLFVDAIIKKMYSLNSMTIHYLIITEFLNLVNVISNGSSGAPEKNGNDV